jgi:hypothetical protein
VEVEATKTNRRKRRIRLPFCSPTIERIFHNILDDTQNRNKDIDRSELEIVHRIQANGHVSLQKTEARSPAVIIRSMRAMQEEYPNGFGELRASAISLHTHRSYTFPDPLPFRQVEEPSTSNVIYYELPPKVENASADSI